MLHFDLSETAKSSKSNSKMKVFEFSVRAIWGSFGGPPFGRPSLSFGTFAKYTYFQQKTTILPSEASQKSTRKSRTNNITQVLEGFLESCLNGAYFGSKSL